MVARLAAANRTLRRAVGGGLAAMAALVPILMIAAPAAAHPAGVPAATDYRTSVRGLTPAVPGLVVRFVADNSQLELTNATAQTVQVAGYQGEPLLQVRPDGVWHNTRSPSLYLDQPTHPAAATADARAAAQWRRVSTSRTARWHDHRTVWHGRPPPHVAANPDRRAHILDWAIPLRAGDADANITGSLDWLPRPNAAAWWGAIALAALGLAGLGRVRSAPDGRGAVVVRSVLAAVSGGVGLCAMGYAVAVAAHNAMPGAAGLGTELLTQTWSIVTGLGALAAGGVLLLRRPAADFAIALAGACVAVTAGLGNAAVFAHSVAPVSVDPVWARLAVAAALSGAVGLAAAGTLRIVRDGTPPRPERVDIPGTSHARPTTT